MGYPSRPTVKILFACSGNRCAYPGCDNPRLTDPTWGSVLGRIAHIRGNLPGSARHVLAESDEERQHISNLILLCPNHHTEVDDLRPDDFPPDVLFKMKADHE